MSSWIIVIAAILANASAGVFMKLLTLRTPIVLSGAGISAILHSPFAWLAVTCYGLALILFTLALSRLELSVAYTSIVCGAIVLVNILSIFMFGEVFTMVKAMAICLILAGVFLLYRS